MYVRDRGREVNQDLMDPKRTTVSSLSDQKVHIKLLYTTGGKGIQIPYLIRFGPSFLIKGSTNIHTVRVKGVR